MLPFRSPLIPAALRDRESLLIGVEGPHSAPPPPCHQIGRTSIVLAAVAELIGEFEKRPEQGGAIVVDELDQAGFLDEAAEFDEMAGASTPVLHPLALVVPSLSAVEPIPQHGQVPQPGFCCP